MRFSNFETMPLVLGVEDIADTLAIGRNKAYTLVKQGEIKAMRIGKHYRVPRDAFIRYIRGETQSA